MVANMSPGPQTSSPPPTPSSPVLPSSQASTKPKRPPPITPNRFNRFFNPRLSQHSSQSGRQLRDITKNGHNQRSTASALAVEFDSIRDSRPRKKRRKFTGGIENIALDTSEPVHPLTSSPTLRSSPCPDHFTSSPPKVPESLEDVDGVEESYSESGESEYDYEPLITRARVPRVQVGCENSTSKFYSRADEALIDDPNLTLPFCTTACHNESVVAVGDEMGTISLLETNGDENPPFSKPIVTFQPHKNALMDMSFSSDDRRLATGSGDQTGRIIDVNTQTTVLYLFEHSSSIKQVSFQPGNDDVVATCSRDGLVALWDLRSQRPVNRIQLPGGVTVPPDARQASQYNVIAGGHANDAWTAFPRSKPGASSRRSDTTSANPRDPSITALQFLPQHPHLLLSASDASSTLRLWDLRARYTSRKRDSLGTGSVNSPVPLSLTAPLHVTLASSKQKAPRSFGVTSLTLSTDGSRTYSVCRDSSVYVYSTPHLILGSAPDILDTPSTTANSNPKTRWAPSLGSSKGAAPLYALRHPMFKATSFYVKGALRQTRNGLHDELLAVGSGASAPILFPTDERIIRSRLPIDLQGNKSASKTSSNAYLPTSIPIYETGTPLIEGHEREVTAVTWAKGGELISLGDDRHVRLWREDEETARTLRTWHSGGRESRLGESIVDRSGWGYASVNAEWDEDDG